MSFLAARQLRGHVPQPASSRHSGHHPGGMSQANTRGILRGPKVEVISPIEASHSPFRLQLKFESFGGARINVDSVKVLYLRTPNVDLTSRVKPFIQDQASICRTPSCRRANIW